MRANLDIPTTFNRPRTLDSGLASDLARLGSAVEAIASDAQLLRVPSTIQAKASATLALDAVMQLSPPASGTVEIALPTLTAAESNREASLVILSTTAATINVRPPKGVLVNGVAFLAFIAAPYWYRFIWTGGSWYHG